MKINILEGIFNNLLKCWFVYRKSIIKHYQHQHVLIIPSQLSLLKIQPLPIFTWQKNKT